MTPARLKFYRKDRLGLSQAALASALGLSRATLNRYETGATPIPDMIGLALAAMLYGLPPVE